MQDKQNMEAHIRYEPLLQQYDEETEYQCLDSTVSDRETRREYLKVLDFVDQITDDVRVFNVCRSKVPGGGDEDGGRDVDVVHDGAHPGGDR